MTAIDDFQASSARYQCQPSTIPMEAYNELIISNDIWLPTLLIIRRPMESHSRRRKWVSRNEEYGMNSFFYVIRHVSCRFYGGLSYESRRVWVATYASRKSHHHLIDFKRYGYVSSANVELGEDSNLSADWKLLLPGLSDGIICSDYLNWVAAPRMVLRLTFISLYRQSLYNFNRCKFHYLQLVRHWFP